MNIREASERSGLPAKAIRYNEEIGLVHPARNGNRYRWYREHDLERLAILSRARSVGFSVEECRSLLSLFGDRDPSRARECADRSLSLMDRKETDLEELRRTVRALAGR